MRKMLLISSLTATFLVGENLDLDTLTVTATKFERMSKEVPQSIAVIDSKEIEERNVLNVKDVLETVPGVISMGKNNGYDSRLIIRGAGLKARYGIREIMVMRDGVPMTDPDSFTRMDFVDIDDMESVEVFKGPGSIYAANATGGVVYIKSKSVFDTETNRVKIGYGSFDTLNANVKGSYKIDDSNYIGVSLSRRQSSNDWREWNDFDTTQLSLKYGHIFEDESTLETEFAYSEANLQLPQSLGKTGYEYYLDTGKTKNGDDEGAWQKSGRYSKSFFFNTHYEKEFGDLLFKPQAYFTQWEHYHPVTGMINDSKDNYVMGLDLAFDYSHTLFSQDANLVFGLTGRLDKHDDSKKYEYRDYDTKTSYGYHGPTTKIVRVTSDERGALANTEAGDNTLFGGYLQETFSPTEKLLVDIGMRYDHLEFDTNGNEITRYDYGAGNYVPGSGAYEIKQSFDLYSPKIGATYALNKTMNAYALIASANQAPTDNEVRNNRGYDPTLPALDKSTSINYEVGLKQRSKIWSMDFSVYYNKIKDEIVAVPGAEGATYYENAGETRRIGAELALDYFITEVFDLGMNASVYDYEYVDYVSDGVDYSGNKQRFIPDYQYSLFAGYHLNGLSARVEALTYGPYYMDDANTEKYDGFELITNVMLGYQYENHRVQLNVNNVFDKTYATEVKKTSASWGDKYYYTPASPRFAMLTYSYTF
ncbi:TonB-dependent receptor [Sulfurovum sp.]|uniref:TonB-dependent receptor n=1 Tax=Sulfurovum sp. TaxID=1969726 RepID=UPI0025F877C3|nr:TonB-dependent receptor [Sulfurovum sp.]